MAKISVGGPGLQRYDDDEPATETVKPQELDRPSDKRILKRFEPLMKSQKKPLPYATVAPKPGDEDHDQ